MAVDSSPTRPSIKFVADLLIFDVLPREQATKAGLCSIVPGLPIPYRLEYSPVKWKNLPHSMDTHNFLFGEKKWVSNFFPISCTLLITH